MSALHGVGVLVTRPEQQAMPLCRLLENHGASTQRFAAMEIKSVGNRREMSARLRDIGNLDLVIFTSTNAVRFGASLLEEKRDLTLAAMGPATARALNQAGYRVAIQPQEIFDSQALLLHPRFEHLAGHRILLIKGCGGRPLLEQELTRRGANLAIFDVYQRMPAKPSAQVLGALHASFAGGALHVITATSLEIAGNLLDVATPALRAEFDRVHWLVPGERVAFGLRERGLTAPLLQAKSAEDHDLVSALIGWRGGASGA
jgi:uroporphyrinogen-III synthase